MKTRTQLRTVAHILIGWALAFAVAETAYFGGNLLPASFPELCADATALVMVIAGGLILNNTNQL